MLVKMLLPERHGNAAMEESVNTAVDKAGGARRSRAGGQER